MPPRRRPLAVSVGAGLNQVGIIRRLKQAGYRVAAFDGNPDAPGFALADAWTAVSTWDAAAAGEWLESLDGPPMGVLCQSFGRALATQQQLIRRWGLPGAVPAELADIGGDKRRLRAYLHGLGWEEPPLETVDDLRRVDPTCRYIVKARHGVASRSVRVTNGRLLAAEASDIDLSTTVVEPFFAGTEHRLAAVVRNGAPVVVNRLRREPLAGTFLTARLVAEPARHADDMRPLFRLLDAHPMLRDALVKIDVVGDQIIEVDFGIAGDYLESHWTAFAGGGDLDDASLKLFLGLAPVPVVPLPAGACLDYVYLPAGRSWTFDALAFAEAAGRFLGAVRVIPVQPEGEVVGRRETNHDAVAAVLHFRSDLPHSRVVDALVGP